MQNVVALCGLGELASEFAEHADRKKAAKVRILTSTHHNVITSACVASCVELMHEYSDRQLKDQANALAVLNGKCAVSKVMAYLHYSIDFRNGCGKEICDTQNQYAINQQ